MLSLWKTSLLRWLGPFALSAALMACSDDPPKDSDGCVPGARKKADDGCNSCICGPGRTWACTLLGCDPGVCVPGDSKTADDGCNTCYCDDSAHWACTEIACEPQCPAPIPYTGGCVDQVIWAKGPDGSCCEYPDPCSVPQGWLGFGSEVECEDYTSAMCPPPAWYQGACDTVEVWARDPQTGICCNYGTPCMAPDDWERFFDEASCTAATGSCEDGDTKPAGDGCNTCSCSAGQWACTEIACPVGRCVADADCMRTGCSGQLCSNRPLSTTCEYLPYYACFASANCLCAAGICGWEDTAALQLCLAGG